MNNINEKIYVLLVQKKINNFSICELKDAYMAEFTNYKTEDEVRKFIYRQVYKLVNSGHLIKKGKKHTNSIKYHQTQVFKNEFLIDECQMYSKRFNETDCKFVLRGKLIKYKEHLVSSIAESEEYQRCINQYPQLINTLKPKLELANHKKSQFLGKITAIENILNSH
jgi:hypothetical protein